jgi:hypothetical protein
MNIKEMKDAPTTDSLQVHRSVLENMESKYTTERNCTVDRERNDSHYIRFKSIRIRLDDYILHP